MAKEKATTGQKIKVWFEKYLLPWPLRAADKQANESEEAAITPPPKLVRQGAVLNLFHTLGDDVSDFHFDNGEISVIGNSFSANSPLLKAIKLGI